MSLHEMQCEGCGTVSSGDDLEPCPFCGNQFCRSCRSDSTDSGPTCLRCLKQHFPSEYDALGQAPPAGVARPPEEEEDES